MLKPFILLVDLLKQPLVYAKSWDFCISLINLCFHGYSLLVVYYSVGHSFYKGIPLYIDLYERLNVLSAPIQLPTVFIIEKS